MLLDPPAPITDRVSAGFAWREGGRDRDGRHPVLLLHGLIGSRLSWGPQLDGLTQTRRVAAWDLPGYGDSDPIVGPTSFERLADAVVAFADVLGTGPIHLVGLSFGGMIAQYAAARHPGRLSSLTLISTSPCFGLDGTTVEDWRSARLAPLDAGLEPVEFAPRVLAAISGPHVAPEVLAGQVAAAGRVSAAALRSSIEVLVTHDARALLAGLSVPTMCLAGELDHETPPAYAAYLAAHIPDARLHVVARAGHLLNVEAPAEVNELLMANFDRTEPTR